MFAKINRIDLLEKLFPDAQLVITASVYNELLKTKEYGGEYQLTDALQEMVRRGSRLKIFTVSSWYDCGHAKSLPATNRVLLDEQEGVSAANEIVDSAVLHPVAIGANTRIVNSVIGPHTSIADGAVIEHSIISNSIIGSRTHISKMNLQSSIIGDDANLIGKHNSMNIGDSSSIEF
ncbi:hypothetical protein B6U67_04850 [Methanosarcinales archaeon ex4484_138]|nr:MAG: hypothetical protein B6U67_04850 [Methanosarcinales archaeon ex4484_138]